MRSPLVYRTCGKVQLSSKTLYLCVMQVAAICVHVVLVFVNMRCAIFHLAAARPKIGITSIFTSRLIRSLSL